VLLSEEQPTCGLNYEAKQCKSTLDGGVWARAEGNEDSINGALEWNSRLDTRGAISEYGLRNLLLLSIQDLTDNKHGPEPLDEILISRVYCTSSPIANSLVSSLLA